jgi:acyl-CoA thioesterase
MLEPKKIVDQMMENDQMSHWLGIEFLNYTLGNVQITMTVRPEMLNGFNIAHGSITYALADSALAFSANSHGLKAVSIETSISHLKPVAVGDQLTTNTIELSLSQKIGVYLVEIVNQDNTKVATFKGTIYRNGKVWA